MSSLAVDGAPAEGVVEEDYRRYPGIGVFLLPKLIYQEATSVTKLFISYSLNEDLIDNFRIGVNGKK